MAGVPGFSKSNVLFYELEEGCAVAVRPSGTEPKIKTYVMARGDSEDDVNAKAAAIRKGMDALLEA